MGAVSVNGVETCGVAMLSAGAGITVSNVAFVTSARLTASFVIDGSTTAGPRDVIVTNPGGGAGTLTNGFTVNLPVPATLTLAYNGRVRDRVGGGDTALAPDGAADGTITLMLSAAGGRTVTALQLQNGIGGVWDTPAPNNHRRWGAARARDRPLSDPRLT